jgi:DNA-binding NtrC family response regulator
VRDLRNPHNRDVKLRDDDDERTKSVIVVNEGSTRRVFVFWEGFARTYELHHGTVTIGRGTDCAICIEHPSVSRRHATLHLGASVAIEDLGSSNGTRVGGRKIAPNVAEPLEAGMLVEIGLATLVVHGGARLEGEENAPIAGASDVQEPTLARLDRLIGMVASSRISVILHGETGVGKEVAAEALHARSPRAKGPLVKINCAALPDALLEAELFGYERGAFTGANQTKPGLVEAADHGTLLLDEVAEMPLQTQAKLLRVLESREVMRVGAIAPRAVDVRFIAATHADLEARANAGTFRRDLFYRLNGITITIPPLRDRRAQIPSLARELALSACREQNLAPVSITSEAMRRLEQHAWPGNVRELRNVLERAILLAAGGAEIDVAHLQGIAAPRSAPAASGALHEEIASIERQRIVEALERAGGNQSKAAKLLGVSRRTLVNRLDEYGLPRPRKG